MKYGCVAVICDNNDLYLIIFQKKGPSMTSHKFRIGDPVWAKMKGFSPWPGKVNINYYIQENLEIFTHVVYCMMVVYLSIASV